MTGKADEERVAKLAASLKEWLTNSKNGTDMSRIYVPGSLVTSDQVSAGTQILASHTAVHKEKVADYVSKSAKFLKTLPATGIKKWDLVDQLMEELQTNESQAVEIVEQLRLNGFIVEDAQRRWVVVKTKDEVNE